MPGEQKISRPLSPHLTIYRPQFTSVLSILHRITGVGLVISLILVIGWFAALSFGIHAFVEINLFFKSYVIQLILVASLWALWYHTCTGIRHLIWDMGFCLDPEWINPSAYIVLFCSLAFTFLTLFLGWFSS